MWICAVIASCFHSYRLFVAWPNAQLPEARFETPHPEAPKGKRDAKRAIAAAL
jgi:hypothetical protein